MLEHHPDPQVQQALDHLQAYYRAPQDRYAIDPRHLPLLIALKEALYATGAYDHEAATRHAMDLAGTLFTQSRRWSVRVRRWWRSLGWTASLLMLVASSAVVTAQPIHLLDCAEVNLLGPACDEAVLPEASAPAPHPSAPATPLFTLQTMQPDTPPLLIQAFNDPTEANIDAFLDWQHQYLSRAFEVQQKLDLRRRQRAQVPKHR